MAKKKEPVKKKPAAKKKVAGPSRRFSVEGRLQLEGIEKLPSDVALAAYAFDAEGKLLGTADVGADGKFSMPLSIRTAQNVEFFIGAAGDPEGVRKSAAYSRSYDASEWVRAGTRTLLQPEVYLPRDIWWPFWPRWVCVSGHVFKMPEHCPVPFTKVEIFDVDREFCLWPYIYRLKDRLKNVRVARTEDLLRGRVQLADGRHIELPPEEIEPPVGPAPPAMLNIAEELSALGPQPEPPDLPAGSSAGFQAPGKEFMFNPQPEPPARVIQERTQDVTFRSLGLDQLSVTSALAPWVLFPRCFYSKQLLCTTHTDEKGYFRCCFRWWPIHFRNGHLRLDWRPDIIIRVTQIINGVEKVLYVDPYTNTRWNVTSAYIHVHVDDADIECGGVDEQDRPEGAKVFFTRVGNDEVYWIKQSGPDEGLYERDAYSKVAYGHVLRVFAQFGDTLSTAGAIPGAAPPYYYRLSYSKDGTNFTPISTELKDTRVDKVTLFSESYTLGPKPVGLEPALYEVRDFDNYYWYNPDWIGRWVTATFAANGEIVQHIADGMYELRLEVFDSNATLLTWQKVDYRDGTAPPNGELPPMEKSDSRTDYCFFNIVIDNNRPVVDMTISPSPTGCGVIKSTAVPPLGIGIHVNQANGRIRNWALTYVKGISGIPITLDSDFQYAGVTPIPHNDTVDGMPMLAGVTTTCAFGLKLRARSHVRNGYGFIYYREQIKAIAIEKCPPCPPVSIAGSAATPITLPGPE